MKDEQGMPLNTVTAKVALAYACPPPPRPTRIQFAEAAPAGGAARIGLAIQAIEVCQVIQSVENSVTLIADKATLVRVYVDQASVIAPARVRGEIAVRTSAQGPATYVPSLNELSLDPAELAQLVDKRQTIAKSLNFRLPDGATRPGELFVEVNRVTPTGGEDQPLTGMRQTSAKFISAPPLRIRCIGLRYRDTKTSKTYAPDAVHFTYLRSFLARAYPVPSVIWSQIVVDADFSAPFSADTVVQANMQLAAIR
ncbi:MAG TPA: hypothetical protein VMM15_25000, partial [Bradyrhizobium sp.]|nr:hypothetical protein [Bradyrhizobium sp.]